MRGKISIIGPENGKGEVDADQFYVAFVAALDANRLALYQHGRFLKIVDKPPSSTGCGLFPMREYRDEGPIIQVWFANVQDALSAVQKLVEEKSDQGRSQRAGAPAVMPMQNDMLMPEGLERRGSSPPPR